jgi:hypothetical protein
MRDAVRLHRYEKRAAITCRGSLPVISAGRDIGFSAMFRKFLSLSTTVGHATNRCAAR